MVRNLCASQEYFQWGIFLTFTCNMIEHVGTKAIREWVDNNKWTIHFSNLYTYYCFQKQEIKRAIHQSALGLFIRVWEEVSTILIDYLINSPSGPFLRMIAVFARKEYQSDVGNIFNIHLLGKPVQLSEQLRTELLDIIGIMLLI